MKTIVIRNSEIDRKATSLEGIMKGALCFGLTFNKDTIVFNTKKEAQETMKNHPCNSKGFKYVKLNKKQLHWANIIKKSKNYYCMPLGNFLAIK